jgi:choline dehydrogenase
MKPFDYVIVGAGSAGCVLAARLSEDPRNSVLLLEAGGEDSYWLLHMPLAFPRVFMLPAFNWSYFGEPEPHAENRRIPMPRGKVLGGSSTINGLMYARGDRSDYDGWRQLGLPGWSYAEVLPYFRRAEANFRGESVYHGVSGPMTVSKHIPDSIIYPRIMETARRRGFQILEDFHGATCEGYSTPDFNVHQGRRASTAARYLRPALQRPNLTVETHSTTTRVLIEHGRATGVEYEQSARLRQAYAAREVILCAGTYNSPQLLLLSGIGPAAEIEEVGIRPVHDLPGVGRNLQDHPSVRIEFIARDGMAFDSKLRFDRMLATVVQWHLFSTGPGAALPVSAMGFYRSRPGLSRPDIQTLVSPTAFNANLWFPLVKKPLGHRIATANVLLRAASRGWVKLRSSDPKAPPRVLLNLLEQQSDLETLRTVVKTTREFFATRPASELIESEAMPGAAVQTDAQIDAFIRSIIGTAMHPTSSCSMGTGPEAVTDAQLKVHGLDGLRVVDASVMPRIIGGNTNAPTIMVAEKAADMILGKPPLPPSVGL